MVISLLDTDTIARYPDIRFIVSHGGGTLPLLGPRIGGTVTAISLRHGANKQKIINMSSARIGVHPHLIPPFWAKELVTHGGDPSGWYPPVWSTENVLKFMDDEGIAIHSNYDGIYLTNPRFDPVWEEMNRRGSVVFIHPTTPRGFKVLEGIPGPVEDYPSETTRCALDLVYRGHMKRFSAVKIILSRECSAPAKTGQVR